MPSELPVQVSGCRCSLCSQQGWLFPTARTKLQRAEMGVINGHSYWQLIPAMDFPTSPSVTPTCVSSTPWHSTGHTGNSLKEGQGSDQELLGVVRQFHGKGHHEANALFSNTADPSQWKHYPLAARKAAACLEKAQVPAQASQLFVLG